MVTASPKIHRKIIRRLREGSVVEDVSIPWTFNLFWQPLTVRATNDANPKVTNVITITQFPVFASADLAWSAAKTPMKTNRLEIICMKRRNATFFPESFCSGFNVVGKIGCARTRRNLPIHKTLSAILTQHYSHLR